MFLCDSESFDISVHHLRKLSFGTGVLLRFKQLVWEFCELQTTTGKVLSFHVDI